jgi:hypothetical protein
VISNKPDSGAYLAFENFKEDTIVDVKPFTPAAVHPDYTINQFTTGNDSSGFVLDVTGSDFANAPALVYRHKPGTQYPVTCRIAPYTNLDWRNYEFSGTIIKPAGDVYDSVGVGVIFYAKDQNNYYALKVKGKAHDASNNANRFIITRYSNGGEDSIWNVDFLFEGLTDTINFAVKAQTKDLINQETIKDGEINIQAVIWGVGSAKPGYPFTHPVDTQNSRKIEGFCGFILDNNGTTLATSNIANAIKYTNIKIQKVGD